MPLSQNLTQSVDTQGILRLLETARAQGTVDSYTGKRRWTRFNAGLPCELTLDPTKQSAEWFVSLHNVSGGGFSCWSKTKVASRMRVFLREYSAEQPGVWIPARITHCTPGIRGFLLGASFENQVPQNGPAAGMPVTGPPAAYPPHPPSPPAYARVQLPSGMGIGRHVLTDHSRESSLPRP